MIVGLRFFLCPVRVPSYSNICVHACSCICVSMCSSVLVCSPISCLARARFKTMISKFFRFYSLAERDARKAATLVKDYVGWLNSESYGVETKIKDLSPATPGVADQIRTAKCFLLNRESK